MYKLLSHEGHYFGGNEPTAADRRANKAAKSFTSSTWYVRDVWIKVQLLNICESLPKIFPTMTTAIIPGAFIIFEALIHETATLGCAVGTKPW